MSGVCNDCEERAKICDGFASDDHYNRASDCADAIRAACRHAPGEETEGRSKDELRMDFLERQEITIRNDDLLLINPPNLRAAIDVAIADEVRYECPRC